MMLRNNARDSASRHINVDRAMEHARDLRARELDKLFAGAARRIRILFRGDTQPLPRNRAARTTVAALLFAAAGAVLIAQAPALSQERRMLPENNSPADTNAARAALDAESTSDRHAAPNAQPMPSPAASALAGYGLDIVAIESTEDLNLLWRVVRELVLPGRISEVTQRRILRRVWMIDPDVANGSWLASDNN